MVKIYKNKKNQNINSKVSDNQSPAQPQIATEYGVGEVPIAPLDQKRNNSAHSYSLRHKYMSIDEINHNQGLIKSIQKSAQKTQQQIENLSRRRLRHQPSKEDVRQKPLGKQQNQLKAGVQL